MCKIVRDYKSIFCPVYNQKLEQPLQFAVRTFYYNDSNELFFIIVDPYSFSSAITPAKDVLYRYPAEIEVTENKRYFNWSEIESTPYMQALNKYTSNAASMYNCGARKSEYDTNDHFLTIDLCPSSKQFEEQFFHKLVKLSTDIKPSSINLFVSGLWMVGHPEELLWLKQQQVDKKLDILWCNHSFSHQYYPDLPNENNFLLINKDKFIQEIIDTEKIMLESDIIPAPFFRFPGLISDDALMVLLKELCLIPIGTNYWVAKESALTPIEPGSIILVHGNSNEPEGIKRVIQELLNLNLKCLTDAFTHTEQNYIKSKDIKEETNIENEECSNCSFMGHNDDFCCVTL